MRKCLLWLLPVSTLRYCGYSSNINFIKVSPPKIQPIFTINPTGEFPVFIIPLLLNQQP
ncbi:MAG: hypothetical protein ACXVJG_13940 [Mucilaginibacter sp.]